ncbi:dTDP-4-dehydrorhamnose reductase [Arachidicoccus sp.]|uniref:dTDP-4-dehydrorhamnose reductase n=1 Tax=Arachidicoccus sp. TaxID=1872624 RepID=UPI003D1B388A
MIKPTVIVSGKNGQVGSELLLLHVSYPQFNWVFLAREDLDLFSENSISKAFQEHRPKYFINCAAYTAVDKAEEERGLAEKINAEAVGFIAQKCKAFDTILIHLSTDYVFDGTGSSPYRTDGETNPVNFYGFTKLEGEKLALQNNKQTIIIRTAWVYSVFGKNFVKTMLRLMNERPEISVVNDQIGSPTYARDLALAIAEIISSEKKHFGTYHYTNQGVISWYDFAIAIKEISGSGCKVNAITTAQFPTPAKRPHYSVLDNLDLQKDYHIQPRSWKVALQECMKYLQRL